MKKKHDKREVSKKRSTPGHKRQTKPYAFVRFTVFFRIIQQDLSYRDACVLGTLIEHADAGDLTTHGWLRMIDIAERTGLHERTVRRAIKSLIEQGWIAVVKGRNGLDKKGTPTSNKYALVGVKAVCQAWLAKMKSMPPSDNED